MFRVGGVFDDEIKARRVGENIGKRESIGGGAVKVSDFKSLGELELAKGFEERF